MARRADHTREELKGLAIEAARKLIVKQGLAKFSAREVAREIGYTIGTIYNVFGTYDDLIIHINGRTLDIWYEELSAVLKSTRGSKLKAMSNHYLEFSKNNYNLWLTLFDHHLPPGKKLPKWYEEKMYRMFSQVEEVLMPHVGNNRKRSQESAKVLWSGIHGIAVLAHSGKLDVVGDEPAEKLADLLIKNYMAGLSGIN